MPVSLAEEPWGSRSENCTAHEDVRLLTWDLCPVVCADQDLKLKVPGFRGELPRRASYSLGNRRVDQYLYDFPLSSRSANELLSSVDEHDEKLCGFAFSGVPASPFRNMSRSSAPDAEEESVSALLSFIDAAIGMFDELRISAEYVAGRRVPNSDDLRFFEPDPAKYRRGIFDYLPLDWKQAANLVLRESNEPRFDLIIRIALDFGEEIRQLAKNPRKILRRERKKTPLARVQQLDSACLAWLVRQPGRTAVEKAGASQQIYSIVREEFYDTLENRVFKRFLRLCEKHSQSYLMRNVRYAASERYKLVKRFWFSCSQSLREPVFDQISELSEIPQPNYVLQFDPKYCKVWQFYLNLVHREKEVESAWVWQARLWSDIVRLFICSALQKLAKTEEIFSYAHMQSFLYIHHKTIYGRRLGDNGWPGKMEFHFGEMTRGVIVDCFDLSNLRECPLSDSAKLVGIGAGADFLLYFSPICGTPNQGLMLCVWGMHSADGDMHHTEYSRQTQRAAENLYRLKEQYGFAPHLKGLIVRSNVWSCSEDLIAGAAGSVVVEGIRLSGNPDDWRGDLATEVSQFVAECILSCTEDSM